jgi:plastocyanin
MRGLVLGLLVFALGLGAGFLVTSPLAGARTAADGTLTGSVGTSSSGNAFSISLSESTVPAGTYEFDITDYATIHNFDLLDPNNVSVDKTTIAGTGSVVWVVTLSPGVYTYHCDAHPTMLKGTLTVTGGTTSTSTTTGTTATSTSTSTSTTTPTTTTAPTTTTTPATTTTPTTTATGGNPLKVRIASVHVTRNLVIVTVKANQLTRATAVLLHKGKRLARTARDGETLKLRLKPRHSLAHGSYVVRVSVTCCGTSATAKRTIRIR